MTPAPETTELLRRVRQQLILAQVRIMEIEDARDELATLLADTEQLLANAQLLADQKLDEAAHLGQIHADLQAQFDHLRHMQHVTNEALETTRSTLATTERSLADERARVSDLLLQLGHANDSLQKLGAELRTANDTALARQARIEQLEGEIRQLTMSRSWRWTRWLRWLERKLTASGK